MVAEDIVPKYNCSITVVGTWRDVLKKFFDAVSSLRSEIKNGTISRDQSVSCNRRVSPVVENIGDRGRTSWGSKAPPAGARAVAAVVVPAAAGAATTITGNGDWLTSAKSRGFKPSRNEGH